jgi:sn-glycerol 3-phosphate transport system ATP-binding protein
MAELTFRSVKKFYDGKPVIHGIDLDIQDGHFVVIVGPSGCGKSTLLRMVAGLEEICAGEIAINGRIVNHVESRDRGCAMVFQNYALYPHMTVRQNIAYPLRIAKMPKADRERRVAEVAKLLDLFDYLDRARHGPRTGGFLV